jgi:hypothetical protein
MPFPGEQTYQKLARLLVAPTVEPSQRAVRIQAVEKDVILPLRLLLIVILGGYFFMSNWSDVPEQPRGIGHTVFQYYFWVYLLANIAAGVCFIRVREMSLKTTQWINVSIGVLDVFLMTGLTFIVDGFDSPLYWLFLVLILHNALAIPLAFPQILLNLLGTLGYITGGVLDRILISGDPKRAVDYLGKLLHLQPSHLGIGFEHLKAGDPSTELRTENPYERVLVLVIWAACCYGIQVLF